MPTKEHKLRKLQNDARKGVVMMVWATLPVGCILILPGLEEPTLVRFSEWNSDLNESAPNGVFGRKNQLRNLVD